MSDDSDDSKSFEQLQAEVRELQRKRTASVAALKSDGSDTDDGKPEGSDSNKAGGVEPKNVEEEDSDDSFKPPRAAKAKQKDRAIKRNTTARKRSPKRRRIGKTSRVKTTRKHLYHLLNDAQKALLANRPNDLNLYGIVLSGMAKSHYNFKFDFFPHDNQEVSLVRRKILKLVD